MKVSPHSEASGFYVYLPQGLPCKDLGCRDEWIFMVFHLTIPFSLANISQYQSRFQLLGHSYWWPVGTDSTLCQFMSYSTNPRSGSTESTWDCFSMGPVLEGKFGEGQTSRAHLRSWKQGLVVLVGWVSVLFVYKSWSSRIQNSNISWIPDTVYNCVWHWPWWLLSP